MPTTIKESIGTKAAFSTGTLSIDVTGLIGTLSGGTFDSDWGEGDSHEIDTGGTPETVLVESRDSDTQVTFQTASTKTSQSGLSHEISRAYSTIAAWESATDGDLVTDDEFRRGLLTKDQTWTENNLAGSGGITDATRRRHLTCREGDRHDGTAGSGVIIDLSSHGNSAGSCFSIREAYFEISYLEGTGWGNNTAAHIRMCFGNETLSNENGGHVHHCIMHTPNSNASRKFGTGVVDGTSDEWQANDNVIYGLDGTGDDRAIHCGVNMKVIHNTIFNCDHGIRTSGANVLAKYNISVGNATDYSVSSGGFDGASTNNISEDGTAPVGPNVITEQTLDGTLLTDTSAGTENFSLPVGSDARNRAPGPDIDSDISTVDIAGNTRAGDVSDIGAFQNSDTGVFFSSGADEFEQAGVFQNTEEAMSGGMTSLTGGLQ